MQQEDMRKRPVFRLLLEMGIPMTISMIANSLYNIVDSIFVSMIREEAMTALSLLFPLQNIMSSIAIGFGIGINAVAARALGASESQRAAALSSRGLKLSAAHGLAVGLGCLAVARPFLSMYRVDALIVSDGMAYARIVFLFSVIINLQLAWQKIYQSVGRMVTSMIAMLIGAGVNIVLDPLVIFGIGPFPKLGIAGAALATGLSQCISLAYYLIVYRVGEFPFELSMLPKRSGRSVRRFSSESESAAGSSSQEAETAAAVIGRKETLEMYSIGFAATVNLLLPSLLISVMNAILAPFAGVYVFVLGVYYKLQNFLYMAANGLVQGMRPLVAYNYGAREKKRVWAFYRQSLYLTLGIMAFGTAICLAVPGWLFKLFSAEGDALTFGVEALRIICIGFLPSAVSVVASGCLEGLSCGRDSLMISVLRYAAVILPVAVVLCNLIGPTGAWHAFWIAEVATAVFSALWFRRVFNRLQWR